MIPSRIESAGLLLSLEPPIWHLRHSRAVAEIAAWLAREAGRAGLAIDRDLVEAAALLHDVDKLGPVRERVGGMRHGQGGASWLAERGYTELAGPIQAHPVTRFADAEWFERWLPHAAPEEILVSYADKRAGQRLESLDARFAGWRRRYPPEAGSGGAWSVETIEAVRRRAGALERRACDIAGVEPEDVRRLAWTSAAFREARQHEAAAAHDGHVARQASR